MDLMQVAGQLSLEFDAVVTGPFRINPEQSMVQVIKSDGYGVALLMGPGKALAPESRPGGLDVWNIRETEDPNVVDMSNTPDMVKWDTDLYGAREALRDVGAHTFAEHDARQEAMRAAGSI